VLFAPALVVPTDAVACIAAPHLMQKRLPPEFSVPHAWQNIMVIVLSLSQQRIADRLAQAGYLLLSEAPASSLSFPQECSP